MQLHKAFTSLSLPKVNNQFLFFLVFLGFFFFLGHLYLSGTRFGVASKLGYQKDMCSKEIGLRAQNTITILNYIVIIAGETYVTIS